MFESGIDYYSEYNSSVCDDDESQENCDDEESQEMCDDDESLENSLTETIWSISFVSSKTKFFFELVRCFFVNKLVSVCLKVSLNII